MGLALLRALPQFPQLQLRRGPRRPRTAPRSGSDAGELAGVAPHRTCRSRADLHGALPGARRGHRFLSAPRPRAPPSRACARRGRGRCCIGTTGLGAGAAARIRRGRRARFRCWSRANTSLGVTRAAGAGAPRPPRRCRRASTSQIIETHHRAQARMRPRAPRCALAAAGRAALERRPTGAARARGRRYRLACAGGDVVGEHAVQLPGQRGAAASHAIGPPTGRSSPGVPLRPRSGWSRAAARAATHMRDVFIEKQIPP